MVVELCDVARRFDLGIARTADLWDRYDLDCFCDCREPTVKGFLSEVVLPELYVGRYARSIETGWLGKVVSVEDTSDDDIHNEVMLKMQGVNELCWQMAGGRIGDWLEEDDIQWFSLDDVKFLKRKGR
jgi:hypothetical protein